MKKYLCLVLCAIFVFGFSSCKRSEYAMERDAKREAAYNNGYKAGYDEGYHEGISYAQERAENMLTESKTEIPPETALQILTNYADGEPVTKEELNKAIWSLDQYYWDLYSAIHDSDSYY